MKQIFKIKILFFGLILFSSFYFLNSQVLAATLSLSPSSLNVSLGQEFDINLLLDTEEVNINAAQAVINFSPSVLKAISVDNRNSVFNFWVEDPTISNSGVSFIGGTSRGASGKDLLVFKARFKAVGAGNSDLSLSEGVVTASDGKGTNVLSVLKNAKIIVAPTTVKSQQPTPVVEEEVKKIVREPIKVSKLPVLPKVRVPLYPDSEKWHNYSGSFAAFWDVPDDVIKVATFIDQNSKTIPAQYDPELFNGQKIGPLKEGIWYLHVRFQNNFGSGPTAHYKIAIDLTPPLSFAIQASEGLKIGDQGNYVKTDNPQSLLSFSAKDGFSGLSYYALAIDGQTPIRLDTGEYKLALQPPGKKIVIIQAVDNAGNIREEILNLEILPIISPTITFIKPDLFVGEGDLLVRGTAEKEYIVRVSVIKSSGELASEGTATVDPNGNWELVIDKPLKSGRYSLEVVAQDKRGALSLPIISDVFRVRPRPLFTIGGIGITQFWFFIGLIGILAVGVVLGFFTHHLWRSQLRRKIVVAERDVSTVFGLVSKDIDRMLKYYGDNKIDEREAEEMEVLLKKLKNDLEKMKKYVSENIEELGD